jgi:carbon-monoxide dehydrogenase medium subunit
MKPAAFAYERPRSLAEALGMLAQGGAKLFAGGQSLGPMLNLRLVQPDLLVDLAGIAELRQATRRTGGVRLGALVTHAMIEDGRVPDPTGGILSRVAQGIAYRAVRNRGTLGGSLAHADPAGDWLAALSALGARAVIAGKAGERQVPIAELATGAFATAIGEDEILTAVEIPATSADAGWGWVKLCRKPGEFAQAIGAVLRDPERGLMRSVIGATHGAPIVLDGENEPDLSGYDPVEQRLYKAALRRARAAAEAAR